MRLLLRFAFFLVSILPLGVWAQSNSSEKIPRVLFLLDGSSSMSESWSTGNSRFQQAGTFILALIDSLSKENSKVEFGLRVFGHQYPAQLSNCFDTKREVMFARDNISQMQARLEALHGYGVSPIAYSLSEAAMEDFEDERKYAFSIILVTDGGESCGGDICKVVNDLLQRKIFFRPYIVSLVDYAPLKDLYKCLGTFLTVSTASQMPTAITKIVDAHREGFVRAKKGTVIQVLDVPKAKDSIAAPIAAKIEKPASKPGDTIVRTITIKKEQLVSLPIRDKREVNAVKLMTRYKTFKTIAALDTPRLKPLRLPSFSMSAISDAPVIVQRAPTKSVEKVTFAKAKLGKHNRLPVLPSPRKVNVPDFVLSKLEPPVVEKSPEAPAVVKPVVKAAVKPELKPNVKASTDESSFTIEKTPAATTEVQLYFTDGNGKFYTTTPQILLTDAKTNKPVHKFFRTVDPNGEPDLAKVPSGTYNITVVGSDRTNLKDVVIEANMTNKIVVTVGNASLQFVWKDEKDKSPVDKYLAVVKRNFIPQPVVRQRCDTVLPYPPGNYHIEINTLPVSVRSVDLSFGTTIIIPIDVPGMVQVTNTTGIGKVMFYYPLGDRYVQFYQMNIVGNLGAQREEFKPGIYEVHYHLAPGLPEKTLTFHVKSNETILLDLK